MTLDLKDVTFTIPFRYDSPERLRNLRTVIAYLNKYFDTNIIVCEEAAERKFTDVGKFEYMFIQSNNPFMHRTRCLNLMAKKATTPFIVNYDTDVLLPIRQYVESVFTLRKNTFDMIYPYEGRFVNFIPPFLDQIVEKISLDGITEQNGHLIHPNSVGGAIFWNKNKFIECGMESEVFFGWGFEDNFRYVVANRLGMRVHRVPGILYHLNHPSSINSANTSSEAYKRNEAEFHRINGMDANMIRNYIKTWEWLK